MKNDGYNLHYYADAKIEELVFDDLMDAIRHSAKWLSHEATVWVVEKMIGED
jgi:hypothetical protein